jgi:indoleamine 2,3-dioxygenase
MDRSFTERGFLPQRDPLQAFPHECPLADLDELGHDLPSLLHDSNFRQRAREFIIPRWTEPNDPGETIPYLRLYYVRLGFLASAYINQIGQPPVGILPRNLAVPLCDACQRLGRTPILSY